MCKACMLHYAHVLKYNNKGTGTFFILSIIQFTEFQPKILQFWFHYMDLTAITTREQNVTYKTYN